MATIIPLADAPATMPPRRRDALLRARRRATGAAAAPLADARGRGLRDLRISVTDRCNFRCVYCMPKDVFGARLPVPAARRPADVRGDRARSRACSSAHGVEKIRLTGGEPLLRRNLERLVEMLAAIGGLDLTLTTNGALLAKKAREPARRRPRRASRSASTRSTTRRSAR